MASITLGTLKTYWQNVSQWVMGTSDSEPKVQIRGRKSVLETVTSTSPISVTAGSTVYFGATHDTSSITEVECGIRANDDNHNFKILHYAYSSNMDIVSSGSSPESGGSWELSTLVERPFSNLRMRVQNNDTLDHSYVGEIVGVR